MSKKAIWIVIAVVLLITGTGTAVALTRNTSNNSSDHQSSESGEHDMSAAHHQNDSSESKNIVDLTNQSRVSVEIKGYKYVQEHIKIKKGTTVTWTNNDTVGHNVMKDHDDSGGAHDAPSKSEEKSDVFASRLLDRGESYSFTFNEVGDNPYHCSPHPYMVGSVTVVE